MAPIAERGVRRPTLVVALTQVALGSPGPGLKVRIPYGGRLPELDSKPGGTSRIGWGGWLHPANWPPAAVRTDAAAGRRQVLHGFEPCRESVGGSALNRARLHQKRGRAAPCHLFFKAIHHPACNNSDNQLAVPRCREGRYPSLPGPGANVR